MLRCVCSVIDHRRRQNVVRTWVTHSAIASCATFLFLPHFDVICDLLLNRRTATWNLFVKLLTSSNWKTSCYLSKIILKYNCKHVPADGVVRAQNKCEIRECFTYGGGDRRKCNRHRKSFQKRSINLKNAWLPPYFMLWNGGGESIQHVISFWLWAKGI